MSGAIGFLMLYVNAGVYFHHTDCHKIPSYNSVDSGVYCLMFAWLFITKKSCPAHDAAFWKSETAAVGFRLELIHFLKHLNTIS